MSRASFLHISLLFKCVLLGTILIARSINGSVMKTGVGCGGVKGEIQTRLPHRPSCDDYRACRLFSKTPGGRGKYELSDGLHLGQSIKWTRKLASKGTIVIHSTWRVFWSLIQDRVLRKFSRELNYKIPQQERITEVNKNLEVLLFYHGLL